MSKIDIAAICTRHCNALRADFDQLASVYFDYGEKRKQFEDIHMSLADIPALLEYIAALEAMAQEVVGNSQKITALTNTNMALYADKVSTLEADRDKWRERAEALERAIKFPDLGHRGAYDTPCGRCTHYPAERGADISMCGAACGMERVNWHFDHARFAPEVHDANN